MNSSKLVRDKVPEKLQKENKVPVYHTASKEEYWTYLKEKLQEQIDEFFTTESKNKIADINEVIRAICNFNDWDMEELEKTRKQKAKTKGCFSKRIILDKVE
ncbi:hypothetical protein GF327_02050 [Candidatus Woesearchaeota archaeon]|nr:hypothetical protein [Candidatus Woesearchaeota archaeon]